MYNDRFTVLRKLGWGHFSTVWLCDDSETGQKVAMKVQKSAAHYTDAAHDEIDMLQTAAEIADKLKSEGVIAEDDLAVVRLIDSFSHRGPNGKRTSLHRAWVGSRARSVDSVPPDLGVQTCAWCSSPSATTC